MLLARHRKVRRFLREYNYEIAVQTEFSVTVHGGAFKDARMVEEERMAKQAVRRILPIVIDEFSKSYRIPMGSWNKRRGKS